MPNNKKQKNNNNSLRANVSINPKVWRALQKAYHDDRDIRKIANSPSNILERMAILFLIRHRKEFAEYRNLIAETEKKMFETTDSELKSVSRGDLFD